LVECRILDVSLEYEYHRETMTLLIFLLAFIAFALGALNLLPNATAQNALPEQVQTAFQLVVGYMKAWDGILAITPLFQAMVFVAGVSVFIFLWHVVIRLIHWVRGATS